MYKPRSVDSQARPRCSSSIMPAGLPELLIERDRSKSALTFALEKIKKSEAELRQIVDVIPQSDCRHDSRWKSQFTQIAQQLEYTGLSLDEVRADDFRSRVSIPRIFKDFLNNGAELFPLQFRSKTSIELWGKTEYVGF